MCSCKSEISVLMATINIGHSRDSVLRFYGPNYENKDCLTDSKIFIELRNNLLVSSVISNGLSFTLTSDKLNSSFSSSEKTVEFDVEKFLKDETKLKHPFLCGSENTDECHDRLNSDCIKKECRSFIKLSSIIDNSNETMVKFSSDKLCELMCDNTNSVKTHYSNSAKGMSECSNLEYSLTKESYKNYKSNDQNITNINNLSDFSKGSIIPTEEFVKVTPKDLVILNKMKIGCDMKNATLFETTDNSKLANSNSKNPMGQVEVYECSSIALSGAHIYTPQVSEPKSIFGSTISNLDMESLLSPSLNSLPLGEIDDNVRVMYCKTKRKKTKSVLKLKTYGRRLQYCKSKSILKTRILRVPSDHYSTTTKSDMKLGVIESINDLYGIISSDNHNSCITSDLELYEPSEKSIPRPGFTQSENHVENFETKSEDYESSFSKIQQENREQLNIIYNNDQVKPAESVCIIPLDLRDCRFENCASNKIIKGIPVLPLMKDFRSFAQFKSLNTMDEEVFEDYSNDDEILLINTQKTDQVSDNKHMGSYQDGTTKREQNTMENQSYFRRNKLNYDSFISSRSGREIIFDSVIDVEASEEEYRYPDGKSNFAGSSPEKLHEDLLNNIYRSVSVKVKRKGDKVNRIIENTAQTFSKDGMQNSSNDLEEMLHFAIENIESNYLKKGLLGESSAIDKNSCEDNEKVNPEKVILENSNKPETKENSTNAPEECCKENQCPEMDKKAVLTKNGIYSIPENDSIIKMKIDCPDTPRNTEIGSLQTYLDPRRDGDQNINEKNSNTTANQSVKETLYNPDSYYTRERYRRRYIREHTVKMDSAYRNVDRNKSRSVLSANVKLMNGKYVYTTSDGNKNTRYRVPKKESFWGSMLKQTAKLVPFFTFHGTTIDLEVLGDTISQHR